jgi:hypothetical protein
LAFRLVEALPAHLARLVDVAVESTAELRGVGVAEVDGISGSVDAKFNGFVGF